MKIKNGWILRQYLIPQCVEEFIKLNLKDHLTHPNENEYWDSVSVFLARKIVHLCREKERMRHLLSYLDATCAMHPGTLMNECNLWCANAAV